MDASICRMVSKSEICAPAMKSVMMKGGAPPSGTLYVSVVACRMVPTRRTVKPINRVRKPHSQ